MKNSILLLIAGFIASCSSSDEIKIVLNNSSQLDRTDAGVVLSAESLEKILPDYEGLLPVLKDEAGSFIPTQVDDMDGDGSWDELFILTDLKGHEQKEATLQFVSAADYPTFETRTNIRFARKDQDYKEVEFAIRETHATNTLTQQVWQMEGIAWENDKLGFRNYFDRRNGMDIFGKVTGRMVLDEVGYKNNPSYHEYNPEWGVDVLKVGNSLGAGSIAYLYKDSLYRVGDNGVGTCKVLIEGPLRSMFRFEFTEWTLKDLSITVVHDVFIEAGKYYFDNLVTYTGTEEDLQFVTGIVNKKSKELFEVNSTEQYQAFFTHDLQSEDTTLLGMGLLIATEDLSSTSVTANTGEGIIETYCIYLNTKANSPSSYRFYTVWERENKKWKSAEGFKELLQTETELMANPVTVDLVTR